MPVLKSHPNSPANVDVVLVSNDCHSMLCFESKLSEYTKHGDAEFKSAYTERKNYYNNHFEDGFVEYIKNFQNVDHAYNDGIAQMVKHLIAITNLHQSNYAMTDMLALNDFMPKLGIKIVWDDDASDMSQATSSKPVIDVEAAQWNLPIKEQFYIYLSRTKTEGTAKSYTSTLDNAVRQFINQEVDANADSIFSYTTPEDVSLCIGILTSSRTFMEENARKHNAMTAALNQYLRFVQSRQM